MGERSLGCLLSTLRRGAGIGHFVTRADLQKQNDKRMSEVLTAVPGLRVVFGSSGEAWVRSGRGRGGSVPAEPAKFFEEPALFSRQSGRRLQIDPHEQVSAAVTLESWQAFSAKSEDRLALHAGGNL